MERINIICNRITILKYITYKTVHLLVLIEFVSDLEFRQISGFFNQLTQLTSKKIYCGVGYVVCGVWCVVCGVWRVVCGVWYVV